MAHPLSTAVEVRDALLGPPTGLEASSVAVRWSASPAEIVTRVVAGQEVAFWVEGGRGLRGRPRVHFLLQPLREVATLGIGDQPVPGASREDWMVWQSLTGRATAARIPTDAARLAARLGVPRSREGRLAAAALRELMASVYEARST